MGAYGFDRGRSGVLTSSCSIGFPPLVERRVRLLAIGCRAGRQVRWSPSAAR